MRTLGTISAVGLSLALAGCDYSCEASCEDQAECSDSSTSAADCEESCEELERKNEDFGCTEKYEAALACLGDLDDVCDEEAAKKECGDESDAWGDCIIAHCEAHPTADGCEPVGE